MKFFIAIALFAVAASARILPADINLTPNELAEVEEILGAIYSPSTDPTTAAMLEQMLFDLLGVSPVKPTPVIVDDYQPPHIGPALVDFPLPEEAIPVDPVVVAPVAPTPPTSSPLVQIIVNVNQDGMSSPNPVQIDNPNPSPVVVVDQPEINPTPVQVVDKPVKPTPVQVVDKPVKPTPVQVVDEAFEIHPEPVLIGNLPEAVVVSPIIVAPAVVGPEILN